MWDINGRVESLPLTNTRDKSGWVESIYSPQLNCEDFFLENKYEKNRILYY